MRLPPRTVGRSPRAVAQLRRLGAPASPGAADTSINLIATEAQPIAQYGIDTASNVATTTVEGIYNNLPPNAQSAIQTGQAVLQGSKPALQLAQQISSGSFNPDDPKAQLAFFASVAAVAGAINPVAGAALIAGGALIVGLETAVKGIFSACGLIRPPFHSYAYHGLLRIGIDTVPHPPVYAPNSLQTALANTVSTTPSDGFIYDDLWIHIKTAQQFNDFIQNGDAYRPKLVSQPITVDAMFMLLTYAVPTFSDQTTLLGPGFAGFAPPTPFETYFTYLLIQNGEYWANGQPSVPVRFLLTECANYWNQLHGPSPARMYQGKPLSGLLTPGATGFNNTYPAPIGFAQNAVEAVMGPAGVLADQIVSNDASDLIKINNMPPLTVNQGPLNGSLAALEADLKSPVVAASAGIAVAGVTTAAIYSFVSGQTLGSLASAGLSAVKDFFLDFE